MRNEKLKIVFFGTPEFAAQILDHLVASGVPLVGVITQPDRPKGRSLQMTSSPVKIIAEKACIPILQPEKCSNPEFLERLRTFEADLFVVVAFGQILPSKLLEMPPLGCINVHPSLLPKYRGAAPIQRSMMNGDKETGVTIQKMVKELDAGDVIAEVKMKVPDEMIFGELEQALCDLSKTLLISVLDLYKGGILPARAQDPSGVTYASKFTPEEGQIRWDKPAEQILNLIRAFSPRPGAWCWVEWNGERKRVKILRAKLGPGVECGVGSLQLIEVQPEGKPKMAAADWLRGAKIPPKFV